MKWVKNRDKVYLHGLMDRDIRDSFWIIIFMGLAFISGLIEDCTKVYGKIIRWKDRDSFHGVMEELIKEDILMINNRDMGSLIGQMVDAIKEIGLLGNNMAEEIIKIQKVK